MRPFPRPAPVRLALLDFDGTLSLIRAGWLTVLASMMVESLLALKTGEREEALFAEMVAMIHGTTGEPTSVQMEGFRAAIAERGGNPPSTDACMDRYRDRLGAVIGERRDSVARGQMPPERYLVPGARGLLEGLSQRGIDMVLASGTDHDQVVLEAGLLGIVPYFGQGIYGAVPPPAAFSKDLLVEGFIRDELYRGEELVAFGDGPVEIAAVARVGGVAVGVASDEQCPGRLDPGKRARLIDAGAHLIVPDFAEHQALLHYLFDEGG
ncbi:MAG: HAD family hydrolase [Anaerolineae bacterium]